MKIALVHDDLIQRGGAEDILIALHEIFPQAPIYTSVASKYWLDYCKNRGIELRLSFLQKAPFAVELNRYYATFLLHALAFEAFDFSEFDIVISSSSRFAHGIITKPTTTHISYMNTPGRMFWEADDYFKSEDYGFLMPFKFLARIVLALPLSHLRLWDYIVSKRADKIIANSKTPQARIKKYYGRDADIIYPFVDSNLYGDMPGETSSNVFPIEKYFLIITRLVSWKRVDIAIEACIRLGLNLKIIGVGSDFKRLQRLVTKLNKKVFNGYISAEATNSKSKIEFLGRGDSVKIDLLKNCIALINTQAEDFGIVPLEAMAAGKPVISYGGGGALETVIPGQTGEFFSEQTSESLAKLLVEFDPKKYKAELCRKQARKFDRIEFVTQIKNYVLRCR
ncbi:glycosyltransferase [candidate division WWE3 bacterium]|nr:glycosyltransferase [candidate division WWE3 bacterium]